MSLGLNKPARTRRSEVPTEEDDACVQAQWLLDNAYDLSQWEEDFLNDLVDQEWKRATERQQEVLDRIRGAKT